LYSPSLQHDRTLLLANLSEAYQSPQIVTAMTIATMPIELPAPCPCRYHHSSHRTTEKAVQLRLQFAQGLIKIRRTLILATPGIARAVAATGLVP